MDRDYPTDRAELEDKEVWPYNDLQSLASELDYGNPVGEARDDLVEHAVDQLDLPDEAPAEANGELNREVNREESREVDREVGREVDREVGREVGGEESDDVQEDDDLDTDAVEVGHQGSEKLQPEGAPDSRGTAVDPPEGLDADDIDPDFLENGTSTSAPDSSDDRDDVEDVQEESGDGGGGLRDRLGLGNGNETPEEIVDEADDPNERARREQFREKLEGAVDGADQDDVDEAIDDAESEDSGSTAGPAGSTSTAQGMVVDEEIVGSLIDLPFNTAAAATGWDGWELNQRERQANARLFVAMCDEHDVDVGPTTMFALSMAGTFAGRAMRYRRLEDDDQDDVDDDERVDQDDIDDRTDQREQPPATATTASEPTEDNSFGFGEE